MVAFCLFLASFFIPFSSYGVIKDSWEYLHTKDGVEVFKRQVDDSGLIAVKAKATFPYSRKVVLSLMIDHEKRHLWVDRLASINRIKIYDGKLDAVSYYKVDLPWPVTDRDFVVRTRIWYDKESDTVHSVTGSVENAHPEKPDFVRAHSHQSTVSLKKVAAGRTAIEFIARVDPRGNLPHWLVNYLQTKWAHVTLSRLRQALSEVSKNVDPAVDRLFSKKAS